MKNSTLFVLVIFLLISCKKRETKQNKTDQIKKQETKQKKEIKKEIPEKFSWKNIKLNTKNIGSFPFLTPPKGIKVTDDKSDNYELDFSKLRMFYKTSNSTFDIEGKVKFTEYAMENPDKKWEQYYFEKSIGDYLKSIGATQIHTGEITQEYKEEYWQNYDDKFTVPFRNVKNIQMWVLKQDNRKLGFQLGENTMAIVEETVFKQTIEKITADKIKEEIDANGFIALHINFETGKSRIKPDSYAIINEISTMLKNNAKLEISIEGHTDDIGNDASNLKLSKNRARSVLFALVDEGIDENRLQSQGFGETKPIINNSTEENRAENRRVELRKK